MLTGCLQERIIDKKAAGEIPVPLTVTLSLPGIDNGSTRALTESDENKLETVDVLVFLDDRLGTETFLYHTAGKNIDGNSDSGNERRFEVELRQSDGLFHRLVILANLSTEVAAVKDQFTTAMTKEEVYDRLLFDTASAWENGSGFRPLPMWGETADSWNIIATLTGSHLGVIPMLRSVARVDIGLRMNNLWQPQGVDGFTLSDVYVYNSPSKGRAIPLSINYDSTGGEEGKGVVTDPSLPSSTSLSKTHYWHYPADNGFIREIYLPETDNQQAGDTPLCLVLGGYYKDPTQTHKSWYRVDFYDRTTNDPEQNRLDILRNHRYLVNITSVDGEGYPGEEEAYQSTPKHMTATVLQWDESALGDIVIEGANYLKVNEGKWNFPKEAQTATSPGNILTIETTHPDGWQITKITDENGNALTGNWLTTDITGGTGGENVRLLLTENTGAADRTGQIHIVSGNLSYIVTVTQSTESGVRLKITDRQGNEFKDGDSLWFDAGVTTTITAQTLQLEWEPKDKDIQVTLQNGTTPFNFGTTADQLTNGQFLTGGSQILMIQPPAMEQAEYDNDPFLVKETKATFTIAGTTEKKEIVIQQLKAGLTFEVASRYLMDGGEHSFTVKSNTNWTATITSNPNNVIQLITTSGGNNTIGEEVRFRTIDDLTNPSIFQSPVKITFTSPLFDPVEVEIICASVEYVNPSNCYVLKPNGTGILIPVSRANEYTSSQGLTNAIDPFTNFTAELVWTDNLNGIADNSNISRIGTIGTGNSGYILVLPGSATGNALVSVKVGGEIKWSWHIWVLQDEITSDHTLNGYDFMDRNLGAITNTPNSETSLGLLYQWGRKDPFPGGYDFTVNDFCPIYTGDGIPVSMTTASTAQVLILSRKLNVLEESILDPLTFFHVLSYTSPTWDWYASHSNNFNPDLWGHESTKTIYDPCPEGWRVPSVKGTIYPWSGLLYNDFLYSSGIKGVLYNNIAYYPAAGKITYDSAILGSLGDTGSYWTASVIPNTTGSAYVLQFWRNVTQYGQYSTEGRAAGLSVRCVRE